MSIKTHLDASNDTYSKHLHPQIYSARGCGLGLYDTIVCFCLPPGNSLYCKEKESCYFWIVC